jgi:ketosteroid isomerase-like protein
MSEDSKQDNIQTLIESAMSRLDSRPRDRVLADERKDQERLELGRRDYDVALAKRLDQLRGALGEHAPVVPPAPQPAATPEPAQQGPGIQPGTLLVTALFSAVAGAVAMWLAIGGNPPPAQPAPVAAPVVVAPTPVIETASVEPAPRPTDEDRVRELIENWRSAWAGRDVDAYLACYSTDFIPANGQTHDAWVAARRKNISTRSDIAVSINELQVERLGTRRMKVHFLQDYASGSYRETAQPKTLLLVRTATGWKIGGEWQGEAPADVLKP